MAHQQRDYELYESENLSSREAEFYSPASPEISMLKSTYVSAPTRHISNPSTVSSSRMSGDILTRMKSREQQMLWGTTIHWFLPSSMFGLLLLGFLGAVSHHLFYDSLDGKKAEKQLTMVRIGTALAFFTKAMLVGSVVIAYRQRVWHTLREKHVSLKGIDGMFAVVEDPTHFTTKEIYVKAKIATAMAVATWIIPLASVLSPAALTTELTEFHDGDRNCTVPTINFAAENVADWRKPRFRPGDSLSFYNITPPDDLPGGKAIDYFDQPSHNSFRLVTLTTLGHQFIQMASPCEGYNCTWTISFPGPWYNCSDLSVDEFGKEKPQSINHTYEQLAPEGETIYFGDNDSPEYQRPQPHYNDADLTVQGIFPQEPRLWLGYTINTTHPTTDKSMESKWGFDFQRKLLRCELQRATYTIDFAYTNNRQTNDVTVTGGRPINPQRGPGITPLDDGYREYTVYHSLGMLARKQVLGWMTQKNKTSPVLTFSDISQTKLVDPNTAYPLVDLKAQFQSFFEEIIITLLSEDFLEVSEKISVKCNRTRYQNNFHYQLTSLWVGYAFSIAVAAASIMVGGFSLIANGITSDTTFSKILVTTRNRTIDRLVEEYEGVCLGGDPFPKELENTQLRFGVIDEKSTQERGKNHKHAAFGTVDEVIPIQKGDSYARLSASGSHYQSSSSWVPRSGASSPGSLNTRYSRPV